MARIRSSLANGENQFLPARLPKSKDVQVRRRVGLNWERTRAALKPRFERVGIVSCEFKYIGCLGNLFLGFAHSLRRRNIQTQEQMEEVALGCVACHTDVDAHGSEHTATEVRRVISGRETQP